MVDPKGSSRRVTPRGTRPGDPKNARGPGPVRKVVRRAEAPATDAPDGEAPPRATSRTTPRTPPAGVVVRPRWHRIVGWVGLALGVLIVILNDVMLFGEGLSLLPFGHSEFYLILGLLVAGLSTWFLGLLDRQTVYL